MIRVTDHAIVRYLERAKSVDVEAIRQHIAETCAAAAAVGAGSVVAEGVRFAFNAERSAVVTVVEARA